MHFAAHLWMPFLDFVFMRRALIGGLVLACSTAPLGVFLILRRMSLIGDAVAHGILPGAALGFWFAGLSLPALTIGGLGAGLSMAGLSAWITRRTGLREDASLAAIYPISLAAGVLILGIAGKRLDLLHLLFGSALAVMNTLGLDASKVNPMGGAIALGHPLGATGAIRSATVVHALKRNKLKYGMVTMCVGMGQGAAGIFESV